jgi:gliding motility-associated-like protein
MHRHLLKYLLVPICLLGRLITANAQAGLCPDNLDVEQGNFTNWVGKWGTVTDEGNRNGNTVHLDNTGVIHGRHTIISALTAVDDPYGGFPQICPNGSSYSIKLGNDLSGAEAESISYTYTIPAGTSVFSMLFQYAIVLQNPEHDPEEQPRFRARLIDLSTNSPLPCVTFDFTASSSLPGFQQSTFDRSVYFKDWTPISLNLSSYAGKTIKLEFITSDCTQGGHFGYAYVDVNPACNGAISGNTICQGDHSIDLTAPFGFQSYQWWNAGFTTLLASYPVLPLDPAPPPGTVFPVIVFPFPGYGCIDTLYATVNSGPKPVSFAGPDAAICRYDKVLIGGNATPGFRYEWTPAYQVNNRFSSNPQAWNNSPVPGQFIVKTTNILTGCFSYDTTYVATIPVDTAITIAGKSAYCTGETIAPVLSVNNASTNIRWFDGVNAIPGATANTYTAPGTGNYWAELSQNGCVDTTSTVKISVHPYPQASFDLNMDTHCVTGNNFLFTNTSVTPDNALMSHLWTFGDNTTQQSTHATKVFDRGGTYTARLVTSTEFGCSDSRDTLLHVFPNGDPDFSLDSVCTGRPVLIKNLSRENNSLSVNYAWDFGNGDPLSTVKDPLPVTYDTTGIFSISLKMTALGCENDSQSVVETIHVHKPAANIRYRGVTIPQGSSGYLHARNIGKNYSWQPKLQLSSYSTQYTEFFAVNDDVDYRITITDEHTCVTIDSIQMSILRKPGYYLPTAFTPNGDGLNDIARPYLVNMKSLKSFSVFNRWGNLVFFSTREGEGWDGKFKGVEQDSGVYAWILEFTNSENKHITEKGHITIIR